MEQISMEKMMNTSSKLTEQQRKDAETFAQLPEMVRMILLAKAEGLVQGAALAEKLAG